MISRCIRGRTARFPRKVIAAALALGGVTPLVVPGAPAQATSIPVACGDVTGLTNAVSAANSNNQADTIVLGRNCSYTLKSGVAGTDNGLPVVTADGGHDLTILGNGATIYVGSKAPNVRHLEVDNGPAATLVLDNVIFAYGRVESTPEGAPTAGSILVDPGANLEARRVVVRNNLVTLHQSGSLTGAGGIMNDGGTVTLRASTVKDNRVSVSTAGDAIFGGGIVSTGDATLEDSTVKGNEARVSSPGAVRVGGGMAVSGLTVVTGSTFSDNAVEVGGNHSPQLGGGLVNAGSLAIGGAGSALTENRVTCTRPGCVASGGGFGQYSDAADASLNSTTVKANTATSSRGLANGGGVYAGAGSLELMQVRIRKNTVKGELRTGGGLFVDPSTVALFVDSYDVAGNKPDQCVGAFGC